MSGTIRWSKKQWNQFLKKKGLEVELSNKQLTRRVRILEKKVELDRAWFAKMAVRILELERGKK